MGYAKRKTASNLGLLEPELLRNHSFFQLVELLGRVHPCDMEKIDMESLTTSLFHFKTHGGLGFPASEVTDLRAGESLTASAQYVIEVSFLGLHGASSPLPGVFLEDIAYEYGQKNGIKHIFLDFFNHRFNVFLHKIWRKYRYFVQYKENAEDVFSQRVFGFIGLWDKEFQKLATISRPEDKPSEEKIIWNKLLSYSGLIAGKSRSPSVVSGIIGHYFSLNDVKILEWQRKIIDVPRNQENGLGLMNCTLGEDLVIGRTVLTRSNKFIIAIGGLNSQTFNDFLPNGKSYSVLKTLVAFLMREQIAYDLRLGLVQSEIPSLQLKQDNKLFLGWNTFVGDNPLLQESTVCITGVI